MKTRAKTRAAATILLPLLAPLSSLAQGFDPKAIPIEVQGWWAPAFGHIHAAAKLPFGQTVSGKFTLNVRVVLHNNPSAVYKVYTSSDENVKFKAYPNLTCPYDGVDEATCAFNVPLAIDTTLMNDGWREFTLNVRATTPDAKVFQAHAKTPIYVDNGKPDLNYEKVAGAVKSLRGAGYYTGIDYMYAWIDDVPRAPVKGVVTFKVRTRGSATRMTVDLDKGHYIGAVGPWPAQPESQGVTLFNQAGGFSSNVPITIDTRQLTNGWHTLAVKAAGASGPSACSYCGPELSQISGVAKTWFYVQN